MRLALAFSVAAFCGFGASAATAQRYWGPDQVPFCGGSPVHDDCRAKTLEFLLAKLQLPTAETLASDGVTGLRVFQYDAFGTIWPATFMLTKPVDGVRREGTVGAAVVHGDGRLATLSRPIWEAERREMESVIEASLEDPPVAPAPQASPTAGQPLPPTCLDAPTVIIEVIRPEGVLRSALNTCRPGTALTRARAVSENVAAAFPVCGHLPIEKFGRGLGRLRACLGVAGSDPLAAADVMNILDPSVGGESQAIYEAEHQTADVTLLGLNGQRAVGRAAVADALKDGALGRRYVRILRANGDPDGVTVEAELRRAGEPNTADPLPLSLRWLKDGDGVWRISDWLVEQR